MLLTHNFFSVVISAEELCLIISLNKDFYLKAIILSCIEIGMFKKLPTLSIIDENFQSLSLF